MISKVRMREMNFDHIHRWSRLKVIQSLHEHLKIHMTSFLILTTYSGHESLLSHFHIEIEPLNQILYACEQGFFRTWRSCSIPKTLHIYYI